jgi:HEAT repeat protein
MTMGFFDRIWGGSRSQKEAAKANPAAKWADRIDRRAQNYDRQEAIQALADLESAEAAEVLLKRFTFHIDPSITDQEEKDAAFRGILRAGEAAALPVRAFAAKAESLAWPMKVMQQLLGETEYVEELLQWLSQWDTEYAKFIDPKVQILTTLSEHKHPDIREQVERFLEDVNEPARFHAVCALLAQDAPESADALADLLPDEESVRVRNRVAEGLATRGWSVSAEHRDRARGGLPPGYTIDGMGRVIKL